MIKAFTFIGGDRRQREALGMISKKGYTTKVYGLDSSLIGSQKHEYSKLSSELFDCDVLMLPLPYNNIEGYINIDKDSPFVNSVTIEEVMEYVNPSTIIILGKADERLKLLAKEKGISYFDIFEQESFSVLNAIPTAEGAIVAAMESSDITIHGNNALVLGYGRIGKSLSRMLKGIGARVSVEARKAEDLSWIEEAGYTPIHLDYIDDALPNKQFIFNTIPHPILSRKRLERVDKDAVIVDLASHPGGTDFKAASELGIKARLDLGIPGKLAPVTAGKIVVDISFDLLKINLNKNKSKQIKTNKCK